MGTRGGFLTTKSSMSFFGVGFLTTKSSSIFFLVLLLAQHLSRGCFATSLEYLKCNEKNRNEKIEIRQN